MARSRKARFAWLTIPNVAALVLTGGGHWLWQGGVRIEAAGPAGQATETRGPARGAAPGLAAKASLAAAPLMTDVASQPVRFRLVGTNDKPADAGEQTAPMTAGAPIDLLKAVDLSRDVVRGKWKLDGGAIVSSDDFRATVQFYEPPPRTVPFFAPGRHDDPARSKLGMTPSPAAYTFGALVGARR